MSASRVIAAGTTKQSTAALSVGTSGARSEVSNLSANIGAIVGRYMTTIDAILVRLGWRLRLSVFGMLWMPLVVATVTYGLTLAAINIALHLKLPSIAYYNALHILIFVLTELSINVTLWSFHQLMRFEAAWNLAFHHTTVERVQAAYWGTAGRVGKYVMVLLLVFQGLSLGVTFVAEWNVAESLLGQFECTLPYYTQDSVGAYEVSPDAVSGDIDFAEIYMYGIPLADGLINGFAPWPTDNPLPKFTITGTGPVFPVAVQCDEEVLEWNGTAPISVGSGSRILNVRQGSRGFNANVEVYLPREGFADSDVQHITTPWVRQECTLQAALGTGKWHFGYAVDEWAMVTGGHAVQLELDNGRINLVAESTADLYTGQYLKHLKNPLSPDAMRFDTADSEGTVLLSALLRAFVAVMDGRWYAPSQGATFSNFMSWGTMPDGLYYTKYTWRGLSGGLGAAFHQVFLQFTGAADGKPDVCEYRGEEGSGNMALSTTMVYAIDAVVSLIFVLLLAQVFITWIMFPVKNGEFFSYCAKNILHEPTRSFYSAQWLASLMKQPAPSGKSGRNGGVEPMDRTLQRFLTMPARFGEKIGSLEMAAGQLWIGPVKETMRTRPKRVYAGTGNNNNNNNTNNISSAVDNSSKSGDEATAGDVSAADDDANSLAEVVIEGAPSVPAIYKSNGSPVHGQSLLMGQPSSVLHSAVYFEGQAPRRSSMSHPRSQSPMLSTRDTIPGGVKSRRRSVTIDDSEPQKTSQSGVSALAALQSDTAL